MEISKKELGAIVAARRVAHHASGMKDSMKAAAGGAAVRMIQQKLLPASLKGGITEVATLGLAGHFMRKKWDSLGKGALGVVGALLFDNFMSGSLNNLFGGGSNAQGLSYTVPLANAYNYAQAAALTEAADAAALYGAGSDRLYELQTTRAPGRTTKISDL